VAKKKKIKLAKVFLLLFDFFVLKFFSTKFRFNELTKSKVKNACVWVSESVHVAKDGGQGQQGQQELGAGGQIEAAQS
jgi:hypothetical protein